MLKLAGVGENVLLKEKNTSQKQPPPAPFQQCPTLLPAVWAVPTHTPQLVGNILVVFF